jgi:hypothetical protein
MTFADLTLVLITFFIVFPAKIKEPDNIKFYDEYSLRLRSTCVKIYTFFYLAVISFYILVFVLILLDPQLYKRLL